MIDETLFISAMFLGTIVWPKYLAIIAAGIPALFLNALSARRYKPLTGLIWGIIQSAAFVGLLKLTSGKYAYSLFTMVSPLAGEGTTAILSPALADRLQVFVLPALVHGVFAAILGLVAWSAARQPRYSGASTKRGTSRSSRRTTGKRKSTRSRS